MEKIGRWSEGNEIVGLFKVGKKENKSEMEWKLLKSEQALRAIGEIVTDATKGELDSDEAIKTIRERLMD